MPHADDLEGPEGLEAALVEAITLTEGSDAEGWAQHRTTREIVDDLTSHLRLLRAGDRSGLDDLRLRFAPTGELQELAIANGWSDRFLTLAARVDGAFHDAR